MSQPARHGEAWSEEEELQLLQAVRKKESRVVIAERHQRTESGVYSHLKKLALEYYFNENRSLEEIQKFTGIPQNIIELSINKREALLERRKNASVKPIVSIAPRVDSQVELLKEIRDLMKEMVTLLRTP